MRLVGDDKTMYQAGEQRLYEEKIFYTDSNFFRVFDYTFLEGSPATALEAPRSMVLTEATAKKFFGKTNGLVGQTMKNAAGEVFTITGVLKQPLTSAHILFNMLLSVSTLPKDFSNNWGSFGFYNYVLLKPHTSAAAFEKKLLPMYAKYMASIFDQYHINIRYTVQPITAIHLRSDYAGEPEELGSMSYIYIFSAVALFMLIIACINYMNLATARSARRAREIGIRKVAGSSQAQLVIQFLVESTVTALLALLLSILAMALLLPTFNQLSGKNITFWTLFQPGTVLILLGVMAFCSIVGGSYPGFYLSRFTPWAC